MAHACSDRAGMLSAIRGTCRKISDLSLPQNDRETGKILKCATISIISGEIRPSV